MEINKYGNSSQRNDMMGAAIILICQHSLQNHGLAITSLQITVDLDL